MPTARGLLWHVWEKSWTYARKAGTVILAASVLIWALTTFPRQREPVPVGASPPAAGASASTSLAYSFAGRIGRLIEPVLRPLGFDWKIGVALVTGFAAKEVIVSTMGVLYSVEGNGGDSAGLRGALQSDPVFSPLVAFCLMLFVLAIPPCLAALATLKAEFGWKWMAFAVAYMFALGWALAFAARLIGLWIGAA
jgi:ferrous iron transport protein B